MERRGEGRQGGEEGLDRKRCVKSGLKCMYVKGIACKIDCSHYSLERALLSLQTELLLEWKDLPQLLLKGKHGETRIKMSILLNIL